MAQKTKIRVAIVGVGNYASSLVLGLYYYREECINKYTSV